MRALIGTVSRVEIADGLSCAIDGDTVRVTHGPTPDDAATQRAASLAEQLAASQRALADAQRRADWLGGLFGALAAFVRDLAAGGEAFASDLAGLPADVADALATLARRVDPQAVVRAPGGGAVDLSVWVRRSDVAALCDRENKAHGRISSAGLAVATIGALVLDGLELPPHLRDARPPQGSADERGQAVEREAEVVRVVAAVGRLCVINTAAFRVSGLTIAHVGLSGGADAEQLAGVDGQQVRLVVEVAGHPTNVSPTVGSGKGPQS